MDLWRSPLYYIRNSLTGAFACGANLSPIGFVTRKEARAYMQLCNLNPNIYEIGFFGVRRNFIKLP